LLVKCKMSYIWTKRFAKNMDGRPSNFQGRYYNKNPGINWSQFIPVPDAPIRYLEIGVADGGNAIHIANSYCKHPDSRIYCVDPWMDYEEYPEYKGLQSKAWQTVNTNIQKSGHMDKFLIHRGFSDVIVPKFQDNFFDIIFVDGNHETDYVYRDGVMALQKANSGGYIIFDDYIQSWSQTMKGIDMFLHDYKNNIEILSINNNFFQVIIQKL